MPLYETSSKFLPHQNTSTVRGFVQLLFHLRHQKFELRRSLECTQGSLDYLKKDVIELQNYHRNGVHIGPQLNETMERPQQFEDKNIKENLKIVGFPEISGEINEQTRNRVKNSSRINFALHPLKVLMPTA